MGVSQKGRELSPVIDPRFGFRAEHMVTTLGKVCAKVGYPRTTGPVQ